MTIQINIDKNPKYKCFQLTPPDQLHVEDNEKRRPNSITRTISYRQHTNMDPPPWGKDRINRKTKIYWRNDYCSLIYSYWIKKLDINKKVTAQAHIIVSKKICLTLEKFTNPMTCNTNNKHPENRLRNTQSEQP